MAFHLYEDVWETTATTGAGDYALAGAAISESITFRTFSSQYADGDTLLYSAYDGLGSWEHGFGTYHQTANSISRTKIYRSSNGNSAVTWGAGTKQIMVAALGSLLESLPIDASGNITPFATVATSGSGGDLTANSVTNAKLAQMAAKTIKGNNTGAAGSATDLTTDQLLGMITRPYCDAYVASYPGVDNNHAKINVVATLDNRGWFDGTNHRYTPQLAGKYRVTATGTCTYTNSNTLETLVVEVFKNGALARGQQAGWNGVNFLPNYNPITADVILSMNGTTDYVEFYLFGTTSDGSPPGVLNASLIVEYLGP